MRSAFTFTRCIDPTFDASLSWRYISYFLRLCARPSCCWHNGKMWIWKVESGRSRLRIPRQATKLFQELKVLAGGSAWVMPGRSSLSKPFSHNAMNQAMGSITFEIPPFTIHDLRRTGSTLLHEKGFASDVIEKALNHQIKGVRGI